MFEKPASLSLRRTFREETIRPRAIRAVFAVAHIACAIARVAHGVVHFFRNNGSILLDREWMDVRRMREKEHGKNSGAVIAWTTDRFTIISAIISLARTYTYLVSLTVCPVIADARDAVGYAATYFSYYVECLLTDVMEGLLQNSQNRDSGSFYAARATCIIYLSIFA